jgi:hypothetical protein
MAFDQTAKRIDDLNPFLGMCHVSFPDALQGLGIAPRVPDIYN